MKIQDTRYNNQTIFNIQTSNSKPYSLKRFGYWILEFGYCLYLVSWLLVILAPLAFAQEEPKAVWATYGMLINDTPGNTTQQNPKIISDEGGGYIIVWEDGRAGYYNIYAQKIDESGKSIWEVAVGRSRKNQNFPQLISDGAGGAIIVWQDYRAGNSDIYAQRINQAGDLLWGDGGIPVSAASAGQFAPELISDGAGGAIITWHDYRSGVGEDVYAQRIDYTGKSLWQENGIPVSVAPGTQWYPKIASDGQGGAIITWTDSRISSADNNIFAQRIDSSGKTLWEENGIPISTAPHNQERPVILSVQEGAVIAWNDSRSGNIDIYLQKVDLNGNPKWQEDGVPASSFPYSQENPKLSPDGSGGVIVVWTDHRAEESDIYAQRILSDGRAAWQENGRPVNQAEGKQKNPEIIQLKNNDWIIIWEDDRNGRTDLFAQRINIVGTPLWKREGVPLITAPELQRSAALARTPNGAVIAVWEDSRFGNYDIYSQKISANGKLLWKESGVVISQAEGSVVQQNIEPVFTENGEIILVFEDARSGYFNIYGQKIDRNGKLAWGSEGIAIAKVAANQFKPRIVTDGAGGAIIAWEDHRIPNFPSIRAQRINSQGKKVWESSLPLAKIKSRQTEPIMISDGANGAIVIWQDDRNILSLQDIYGQRISSNGSLLWGEKGKAIISANGDQVDAAVISAGAGEAILAWTDYRSGDRNPDIYAQKVNGKGEPLWQEDGVLICGAPDIQRTPNLIADGEGGAIIAWTDKGGGSYDIYAQRVNKSGQPLWMKDGIPISQLSRTQQNPLFGRSKILVWEDYRFGNWDIFAGAVDLTGRLIWGEDGVPVTLTFHTQYAPQIAAWKNGSVIIAWEDYRSGKQYEIYIQKLNHEGKPAWAENGIKVKSLDGGRAVKILTNISGRSFYIFWEDYTNGGRAIYGQKFIDDID